MTKVRLIFAFLLVAAVTIPVCATMFMGERVPENRFNLDAFSRLPVMYNGRVRPIDSVARTALLIVSNKQTYSQHEDDKNAVSQPAVKWLLDVMSDTPEGRDAQVFRIDNKEVKAMVGLAEATTASGAERKRFSFVEIREQIPRIFEQAATASRTDDPDLTGRKLVVLRSQISQFDRVRTMKLILPLAPLGPGEEWGSMSEAVRNDSTAKTSSQSYFYWATMLDAYHRNDPAKFNRAVAEYSQVLDENFPELIRNASRETRFNRINLFYWCIFLYVAAFLFSALSWIGWRSAFAWSAFAVLVIAFSLHSGGMIARIYLHGRPPVTNLYSSALFIGWGAIFLALLVELFSRRAIASAAAGFIGAATLVIAHNLQLVTPETMGPMQAVLDNNFWLSTHVLAVTTGYLTTILAGVIGLYFIFYTPIAVLAGTYDPAVTKIFGRNIYGVVCFGLFFSFVGTVLGGIWADQSWGRFWGWDPKENGAVMVVLANAIILHARWAGLIRERGMAVLSVFSIITVIWAWFGINMLSVGLHNYGFMDSARLPIIISVAICLFVMAVGLIPLQAWQALMPRVDKSEPATATQPSARRR